jgi:enamine deaminase RidA (YjgF/YER057c/UK114 family)
MTTPEDAAEQARAVSRMTASVLAEPGSSLGQVVRDQYVATDRR